MSRFGVYQPWYMIGSALLLIGGIVSYTCFLAFICE